MPFLYIVVFICLILLTLNDAVLFGEVNLISAPESNLSMEHITAKHHHIVRHDFAKMSEERGCKIAVEVGVQSGHFARENLKVWGTLTHYFCVDMWKNVEGAANYIDASNVTPRQQEQCYNWTVNNLKPYGDKGIVLRKASLEAALMFPNESVDFIYLDARHDYCGVMEDLVAWWPKLKKGGIMSGHDYLTQAEATTLSGNSHGDWSVCQDGSIQKEAVKGAVQKFASEQNTEIYETTDTWPSWFYSPKGLPKRVGYESLIAPLSDSEKKQNNNRKVKRAGGGKRVNGNGGKRLKNIQATSQ